MTESIKTGPASKLGVALVTGASAGIGATYAKRLAARGYDLILIARRADRLDALAVSLRAEYGVHVTTLPADLAISGDVERVAEHIERDESITMLINNAGVGTLKPVGDMGPESLAAMTDVNVSALVRLSQAAILAFRKRNAGTLVNIGSVLGFHSLAMSAAYSGTKGYVMSFTRGLQAEVEGTNIVVQLVAPATTATDIWERAGIPLEALGLETVMSVDNLVDAALAGLDQGELVTLPSVEDPQLFTDYEEARSKLFAASQNGTPASRYKLPA